MHCQAPEKRTTGLFLTQQQMARCHRLLLQAENLKRNIVEEKKKKNRAQIAVSSTATYPKGKIKEVQHLFDSQESYNYKETHADTQ